MAGSSIDEALPSAALLRPNVADTSTLLRRRLLAEIMPSILHELSQPLTCVMLHQAVCRRALASDTAGAEAALDLADRDAHRAGSIIETMNLLSSDAAEPVTEVDLNTLVVRAAALIRRHVYDRRCTMDYDLAPLPTARLSPTAAMDAILRAIVLGARPISDTASSISVVSRLDRAGRHVQLIFRADSETGRSNFAAAASCDNYAHVAQAIRADGGRIGLGGGELMLEFPVADGSLTPDAADA